MGVITDRRGPATEHEHPTEGVTHMALDEYSANAEIIGRAEINDLEAILAVSNTDVDETIHVVADNADAIFTWDYEKGERPALNKLYEKAKHAQWNGETDLPWDTDVDLEKNAALQRLQFAEMQSDVTGTPLEKFTEDDFIKLSIEMDNWTLSQFMHGEQGALICTAKIVETVPWIDAKYYASTQVMDEARHVEVFAKYLQDKQNGFYPINAHLKLLLDDIINDSRWDMTYLGMQIMVEGLALAAFGFMQQMTPDPLLKQLLRYVMSDEARHVEVFAKYLQDKQNGFYPINAHLKLLLDDIINDSRWDMTYLGMQIMVEGLALAAFGFMQQMTPDPLLKQLLRYVMSDEARHVAFGVLSLKEYYGGLTDAELRERQEFAFEAAIRMRDRFLQQEVWERMGIKPAEILPVVLQDQGRGMFQQMLFSKIVPNCKKLGLLDGGDGWLRTKFTEMGVIQFEDWQDTGEEYESLQATG
jgi:hypothetical protein